MYLDVFLHVTSLIHHMLRKEAGKLTRNLFNGLCYFDDLI